ncbi:MAG: 30S ribosomal protein S6e [Candidatus Aenigmarchaeota archaeon]|nr:30S ribosomal protein S6e [Candidatus Aenigmarchaeota archaeon]
MAVFKFVVSEKERTVQMEKDQKECPIVGKKIGENFSGEFLGLDGYELQITGGHDKNGIPMRKDVDGIVKRAVLAKKGVGFSARLRRKKKLKDPIKGLRKKKTIRGNTITNDVVQVNCKIIKSGPKSLNEIIPPKAKEEKKSE